MKIIVGPRRSGKSTDLVHWAATDGLTLVVASLKHIEYIRWMAREMKLPMPDIVCARDIRAWIRGRTTKGFLIDEAALCLQSIAESVPIVGLSMTLDDEARL